MQSMEMTTWIRSVHSNTRDGNIEKGMITDLDMSKITWFNSFFNFHSFVSTDVQFYSNDAASCCKDHNWLFQFFHMALTKLS
jgi:hypothetical protein